ncbi:stalk domain-containing protein [Paenibacillus ferrarius]|uniref:stalk domain-containing protein n=1 Tax=Paenibacillus ferrarius TaxID=1469647 RepID=UPI003D2C0D75
MDKKKLLIGTAALLLCFAGAVKAASLNGDYAGNPIVKVLFGGKELQVEDVPGVIQDGRTLVPLYLLKQTGASVNWDPDKYAVDVSFPNKVEDFAATIPALNEQAKAYAAKNIQLIYNEYGPYVKAELEQAGDSNTDNDHIIAVSQLLLHSPVEELIVETVHNHEVFGITAVKRLDAEQFHQKKLSEYDFIRRWRVQPNNSAIDLAAPNRPQPTPPQPTVGTGIGPACQQIRANYNAQMQEAVNTYNANVTSNSTGFDEYLSKLQKSMEAALKENHC